MCKWMCGLWILFLLGCGTDSDDGLTEDERRSQEIWSVTTSLSGLWATYTPVPEDFTVFSDSALVQEFLDINGLSPTLTVRDVARPEKGGTRFRSIQIDFRGLNGYGDTLIIPSSWAKLQLAGLNLFGANFCYVRGLAYVASVRDLSITGTMLTEVPKEVVNFDLVRLSLFSNKITDFPEWLVNFVDSNKIILWIDYNQIQIIPENLLQKHWRIEMVGNAVCTLSAEDSANIFDLSKPSSGGYTLPSEYLSEPALDFFPQKCE